MTDHNNNSHPYYYHPYRRLDDGLHHIDKRRPKAIESSSIKAYSGIDIAASWHVSQKDQVLEIIRLCKQEPRMARVFFDVMTFILKGQINRRVEPSLTPTAIGFAENKMTDNGLQRHGELVCMKTNKLFNYFAIGSGSSPTTSQSNVLDVEIGRSNMDSDDGFRVAAGNNIIECGYFDETYPSFTASESGCFDGDGTDPTNEIMEWRAVYPVSQQVAHTQNVNFMTYIHTIYQRAI